MIGKLFSLVFVAAVYAQSAVAEIGIHASITKSSGSYDSIDGYGTLDISPSGSVTGKLCVFQDFDVTDFSEREDLGIIRIKGTKSGSSMQLRFEPDRATDASAKELFPNPRKRFTLKLEQMAFFGTLLPGTEVWNTSDPKGEQTLQVYIQKLPMKYKPPKDIRYFRIGDEEKPFDLSIFDKMNSRSAFQFMTKVNWDTVIGASVVQLIYRPRNRAAINQFLKKIDSNARLIEPNIKNCGAEYVQDIATVTPLLEYFVSRQLQKSGLALAAYPVEVERAPGFLYLALRTPLILQTINDDNIKLDQKSESFIKFFETQIKAFLKAKRPKAANSFVVRRQSIGVPLGYKAEITGASISECQATGWEQFQLQVLLNSYGGLSIQLQAPSGFKAPGTLATRPPDARFKENPLTDDQLSNIQDDFAAFLTEQGIAHDNDAPESKISTIAACDL